MVKVRGSAWEAYLVVQYKVRHYICSQQNGIFYRKSIQEPLEGFTAILGYVSRTINHGIAYGGNNEHAKTTILLTTILKGTSVLQACKMETHFRHRLCYRFKL